MPGGIGALRVAEIENIRRLLEARGMNQITLAKASGFNQGTLSKILGGLVLPNLGTLDRLADALGVESGS